MRHERASRLRRGFEWTLFAVGAICLVRYGWMQVELHRLESENAAAITQMLAARQPAIEVTPVDAPLPDLATRDPLLIGQLDIPRLEFSAAVVDGSDDHALSAAVAYLPDTVFPWETGNAVLAAHRDRLFRPLQNIRIGDDIRLSTRRGDFQYRVSRIFIVDPSDVWVLDSSPDIDLTLITCYPFVYVGHAPHRFVVRARKIGRAD